MTDAIKRAAEALVQYETSGMCLPGKKCQMCDCGVQNMDRVQLAEDLLRNQDRARHTLTAALSDREGMARVLYERHRTRWAELGGGHAPQWDDLPDSRRDVWRDYAGALVAHLIGEERP